MIRSIQSPSGLKQDFRKKRLIGKSDAIKYSFEMKGTLRLPCVLFGLKLVIIDRNKTSPPSRHYDLYL
jgi:hypothetical protein